MTNWNRVNPGYEEARCVDHAAHPPHTHEADGRTWWCLGRKAHIDTMIGRQG